MTHNTPTHVHDPDPPCPPHLAPWNDEIASRLKTLHERGLSHALIARTLSSEFNISISRNASIGKARRLGLSERETTVKLHRWAKPKPVVVPPLRPADPLNLPLSDITSRFQCRWITNEDMAEPLYCGQPTIGKGSWCPAHRAICFTPRRSA